MSTHPIARKYAVDIVLQFIEKYTRATHYLAESTGVGYSRLEDTLIHALRMNQHRWERLKYLIKDIDKNVLPDHDSRLLFSHNEEFRKKYLVYAKYSFDEAVLNAEKDYKKVEKQLDLW